MDSEKQIERISEMTTVDGKNLAAVALGRKGGAAKSEAKARASRRNGLKGVAGIKRKARERQKRIEENERNENHPSTLR